MKARKLQALLAVSALGCLAAAQTQVPKGPEFEVASIKPMKGIPDRTFFGLRPGGHFFANGVATKFLIEEAYGVKDSQLVDVPSWLSTDRYDIDAKCDEATAAALNKMKPEARNEQIKLMLQALLADRFKLSLGHETKDLSVYALLIARNGPKLTPSASKPAEKSPDMPRTPGMGGGAQPGIMMNGRGQLTETYGDMDMLANALSRFAGRPVVNKTGLTGRYDLTLKWTPDDAEMAGMGGGPRPGGEAAPPPPDPSGPSLFTAVQEQLGLKLDPQKTPMEVLVIQHVEHPTEN
jgi:uncharacterized protein (TIGR03435 family)